MGLLLSGILIATFVASIVVLVVLYALERDKKSFVATRNERNR